MTINTRLSALHKGLAALTEKLVAANRDDGQTVALHQDLTPNPAFHFSYLMAAIQFDKPEIFGSHVTWAYQVAISRNLPPHLLSEYLAAMDKAASYLLEPADYAVAKQYFQEGFTRLKQAQPSPASSLMATNPLHAEAREFMDMLLDGNRLAARELVFELIERGCQVEQIYQHVFQASLYEVGLLWQTNKISVAHEHYFTAATQWIMANLYPLIFKSPKKGVSIVACTVGGDLHEMGIRMVADLFEMDGWDTYYLGADMPSAAIISALQERNAKVLAVSVTMPFYISKVQSLIRKIRQDPSMQGLYILVGGYAFIEEPDLCHQVGADASAATAAEAIKKANQLVFAVEN